ncbi:MAG: AraC family transcriptional regulator, partial [Clostridia bacterium]
MSIIYDEFKNFSIDTKRHSKDFCMSARHCHDAYEIYITEQGSSVLLVGDEIINADTNNAVLIAPNIPHGNFSKCPHERTVIYFDNEFLDKFLTPAAKKALLACFSNKLLTFSEKHREVLLNILNKLKAAGPADESNIFILLDEMLLLLNRSEKSDPRPPSLISGTLGAVISYLNVNFTGVKSVRELAEKFYITEGHLCRLFRDGTGLTVTQYINNLKVNAACDLLRNTSMPITDISFEVGYNSLAYFCRMFHDIMGDSPKE